MGRSRRQRTRRYQSCTRKIKHASLESAAETYTRMEGANALQIYLCQYCGYLHLGNQHTAFKKQKPARGSLEGKIMRTIRKLLPAVNRVEVLRDNLRRLLTELDQERGA